MTAGDTASDGRMFSFFQIDNAIIDVYGAKMGPYGIAVYVTIARHINQKSGVAFPSIALIAAEAGTSRAQVNRAIKKLKELGLMHVTPRKRADGGQTSNEYELVSVTVPVIVETLTPVSTRYTPPITQIQGPVSDSDTPRIPQIHEQYECNNTNPDNTNLKKDSPAAGAAGNGAPPAEHKPPTPAPASPTKKAKASSTSKKPAGPPKPEYWGDLVAETIQVFGVPRGVGAKLAEQLAGVAGKGERAANNCEPAATVGDVTAFVKWFRCEHVGIDLPTSAEALSLWWHRYHAAAEKRAETVYANGMTRAEVDARWAEMQAEMQARQKTDLEQEAYEYAVHLQEVA